MRSKFAHLKEHVIELRKQGVSVTAIEKEYGIARSTLSLWFRNIELTPEQKALLANRSKNSWSDASRAKATKWHTDRKAERLAFAENEANRALDDIDMSNKGILEIAMALLYLGEGFKKSETGMGNSDPLILRFFIFVLVHVYSVTPAHITCHLHLRYDQDPSVENMYWSQILGIPLSQFRASISDARTQGRKTYEGYHGVCLVRCGNIAIQRKLVYLSRAYCEKAIGSLGG